MKTETFINEGWVTQNDLISTLHKEVTNLKNENNQYLELLKWVKIRLINNHEFTEDGDLISRINLYINENN